MRHLLLFGLFGAFAGTGLAEDKKKEADLKLDGTYQIVSGEEGGKPLPGDHWKGATVTFKGDKVYGTDKDKKEFFAAQFTIDVSKKPYHIMMVNTVPKSGEKASGVISVDGDTVKLAYNLPGGEPPTDFKTKEKQHLFVLKRDK